MLPSFAYRNAHVASNDAAVTLICAVQVILPENLRNAEGRSLQEVADGIETASQNKDWITASVAAIVVMTGTIIHLVGGVDICVMSR